MSLVNCKECGNEVSTQAKTCPHCGAKVIKPSSPIALYVIVGVILFTAFSQCTASIFKTLVADPSSTASNENLESSLTTEAIATPSVPSLPAWEPPAGFNVTTTTSEFQEPQQVAYRWLKQDEIECSSYMSGCYQMEIVSEQGCKSLYVSVIRLAENGTNIGYTNDTANSVAPNQIARLSFSLDDEDAIKIGQINCH